MNWFSCSLLSILLILFMSLLGIQTQSSWINPFSMSELEFIILTEIRMVKSSSAFIAGAAIGLSSHLLQLKLRNPLAEPGVLGISSLVTLFVITLVATGGYFTLKYDVFFFVAIMLLSLFAVYCLHWLSNLIPTKNNTVLILLGVLITLVASSIIMAIQLYSDNALLRQMSVWAMGSMAHVGKWQSVMAYVSFIILMYWLTHQSKLLDSLYLGTRTAQLNGFTAHSIHKHVLPLAALFAGIAISLCGALVFYGLVVPYLIRLFSSPKHSVLLPKMVFFSGAGLVVIEWLSRNLMITQLPLNILLSFTLGPLFIMLLIKRQIR